MATTPAILQALQAVEVAWRWFFFAHRAVYVPPEALDSASQLFLEPPYFTRLDAAKTFLGDFWQQQEAKRR
ncbi:hypothetical protein B296_00033903 [Ensete ventricosum]|uniref:Hs1pro-1 C-terminal domain-containing protein n=1 Tax=Ensete ventricosum TaxID=4639 RepID=A0A426XAA4_ENSVE|nr:hypothetical protein B296_00033903 [Ensete ventricosum]